MKSLRRRLDVLEGRNAMTVAHEAGRLTVTEMENLVGRIERRESLSANEMARLERWGPAFAGELAVYARRGGLLIKRYAGINLADV
jgi:hypothetical protein